METIYFDDTTYIWKTKLNRIDDKSLFLKEAYDVINSMPGIKTDGFGYTNYDNSINFIGEININKKLDDLLVRDVLYDKDMLSLSIYGKIKPEIYSKVVGTIINQYLLILDTNIWTTIPSPIVYFGGNLYYDINTGYINGLDNTKNYKIE